MVAAREWSDPKSVSRPLEEVSHSGVQDLVNDIRANRAGMRDVGMQKDRLDRRGRISGQGKPRMIHIFSEAREMETCEEE